MSAADSAIDPAVLLQPGRWTLARAGSSVEFRVPHTWGLATVKGHFARHDGHLTIDEHHRWSMELTIDAGSLATGNRMRDKDLRSAKFFDIENHPEVTFQSTEVTFNGDRPRVAGTLAAGGRSVTIQPDTTIRIDGDELDLNATAILDQRELGMTHSPLGMVRTPSTLIVHATLHREP
jgi:polyisoprenoid-binding protein YceI